MWVLPWEYSCSYGRNLKQNCRVFYWSARWHGYCPGKSEIRRRRCEYCPGNTDVHMEVNLANECRVFFVDYVDFMMNLCRIYDEFMLTLWWIYIDFMIILCRFCNEGMLKLWCLYVDFMVNLYWFCDKVMLILWWIYVDFMMNVY